MFFSCTVKLVCVFRMKSIFMYLIRLIRRTWAVLWMPRGCARRVYFPAIAVPSRARAWRDRRALEMVCPEDSVCSCSQPFKTFSPQRRRGRREIQNSFTILFIPDRMRATLKLSIRAIFSSVIFKYVKTCAVWIG